MVVGVVVAVICWWVDTVDVLWVVELVVVGTGGQNMQDTDDNLSTCVHSRLSVKLRGWLGWTRMRIGSWIRGRSRALCSTILLWYVGEGRNPHVVYVLKLRWWWVRKHQIYSRTKWKTRRSMSRYGEWSCEVRVGSWLLRRVWDGCSGKRCKMRR